MTAKSKEFKSYLKKQNDPAINEIASKIRKIVLESNPKLQEGIKWGKPTYSLEKTVAYIHVGKGHVNLGFYDASKLEDTYDALEGTGKKMRHIKFHSSKDATKKLIKAYISQYR